MQTKVEAVPDEITLARIQNSVYPSTILIKQTNQRERKLINNKQMITVSTEFSNPTIKAPMVSTIPIKSSFMMISMPFELKRATVSRPALQ